MLLTLIVSVLCYFCFFVFVLCLVCRLLPVSLDCPLLIAPLVFSNVYEWFFFVISVLLILSMKSLMSLKIPKGGNKNLYVEEEQTTHWPKEKVQKDK